MFGYTGRLIFYTAFVAFFCLACNLGFARGEREETIMGTVVKSGKTFIIEADDGDYVAKGKDLTKLVGKLVEATGIITEGEKGDVIEIKSIEDIQETQPD